MGQGHSLLRDRYVLLIDLNSHFPDIYLWCESFLFHL